MNTEVGHTLKIGRNPSGKLTTPTKPKTFPIIIYLVYKKYSQKYGVENEGLTKLYPAQVENNPLGNHQSLTILRIYFVILPESSLA